MPNSMRFVFARATFARQCVFIALMLSCTCAASAPNRAACEVADRTIRAATPLSQCRTPSGDVLIGSGNCVNVFVDQSYTGTGAALGAITINAGGSLSVPDASVEIEAKSIIVVGVPGNGSAAQALLQIGTAACPIGTLSPDNHVTLRLTGERPAATKIHPHDHKSGDDCTTIDKGIGVGVNGQLRLFGARGVPPEGYSWTALSRPAGPSAYQVQVAHRNPDDSPDKIGAPVARGGELTLKLEHDVTKGANPWKTGDWIVVGTTSFSPFESEFVQIDHVSADEQGSQIVLNAATPLRHYHFGGPDPGPAHDIGSTPGTASRSFHLSQSHNFGVDERAEVGLISRNIQLTAATPKIAAPGDKALHWGGEMRFCKGYDEVSVQGVELEKFGKENLGGYPLHFHLANTAPWTPGTLPTPPTGRHLIDANSIHHTYNKCATIHSTSNITLSNNVCARITGHMFYQEIGDEFSSSFKNNLGLGIMLNDFGLAANVRRTPDNLVMNYWEGDYLGRAIDFDGLKVANTDNGTNPVIGQCYSKSPSGGLEGGVAPAGVSCPDKKILFEPPTGFWIVNPTAMLEGNSVGGCQGLGKGYWYVAPTKTPGDARYALKFQPVGRFVNNRVHSCYDGIFGETDGGVVTEQLQPKVGGDNVAFNLIARFDGFTATRIRNRGVWMRGPWFVFDNARVATSREAITMVTAGGLDGSSPAFWGLLKNSVVVGLSKNNVDRWGPCPEPTAQEGPGCVDRNTEAADLFEKSYPSPAWNFAGFYIYDGPVRIHDTRFVNFRHDITPLLTVTDAAFLASFKSYYKASVYEGDAALGWFQNNQSAYPTTTEVRGLTFEGTNLRHQVFTDKVNFGNFDDGDKNTAVIDRDGSLTGFRVVDGNGLQAKHRHAVSLNNLPFNAVANAADECVSTGAQDAAAEDRPTSLISPGDLATLEFGALLPPDGVLTAATGAEPNMTQLMTFTQDVKNRFDKHTSMTLHSRNNQGIWEPKIHGGRGYTVSVASAAASNPGQAGPVGMPRYTNIGLTDVVKPDIATKPFYARIGVCYTNIGGTHPPAEFAILRGFKSWGGNAVNYNDPTLRKSFNRLVNLYNGQTCHNLDSQSNRVRTPGQDNTDPLKGCPADGVLPLESAASCTAAGGKPARSRADVPQDDACVFETRALKEAKTLAELTDPVSGEPVDLYKYFYDAKSGIFSFYVVQDIPNAPATSPLGSCRGSPDDDPACPNPADPIYPESYYGCPARGCITYTVRIVGGEYAPGASACGDDGDPSRITDATAIYRYARDAQGRGRYELDAPQDEFQLAYVPSPSSPHEAVRRGDIVDPVSTVSSKGFDHVKAKYAPYCGGQPRTAAGNRIGE